MSPAEATPLSVIAPVSRVVTMATDRLSGDRSDCPLLVAAAAVEALKNYGVGAQVFFGRAAWIEVLENHAVRWAGCWGGNFHFWAATQYGEVVDLNASVAFRKRAHSDPGVRALYSPPILWSREVPSFYRYVPEGLAELSLDDPRDQKIWTSTLREIQEKCQPSANMEADPDTADFPNEAILGPGRKLLDDAQGSFRHFDRAVSVAGLPPAPF